MNINIKDQVSDEVLFYTYAGKDPAKWEVIRGTQVVEIDDGKGEIVQIRQDNTFGVMFDVRFENFPDKLQGYAPFALKNGTIAFSKVSKEFEEERLLMVEIFKAEQQRLEEKKRLAEMKEKEQADLQHLKRLCEKYFTNNHQEDTPAEMLYVILLKREDGETLSIEELKYLEARKEFFFLAQYYEQLNQQIDPDPWNFIKSASYWRKAELPDQALNIIEGMSSSNPRIQSAILVTKGGAYRDNDELEKSASCAKAAIKITPNSYYPYNLMGAIAFQSGLPEEGEEYFKKAVELGSQPKETDASIREAVKRADLEEKITTARYLLNKDPIRYQWAAQYIPKDRK